MHSHCCSLERYFDVHYPCCSKINLSWEHKQFSTWVHTLFYIYPQCWLNSHGVGPASYSNITRNWWCWNGAWVYKIVWFVLFWRNVWVKLTWYQSIYTEQSSCYVKFISDNTKLYLHLPLFLTTEMVYIVLKHLPHKRQRLAYSS